jgi:hypothetical protein
MADMKFIINHDKNEYILINIKYKIFIRLTKNNSCKTFEQFKRNTKIDFISMQDIIFGKKYDNGTYNLSEFGKNLAVLRNRLLSKNKIYFMAAEKMQLENVCINL